MLSTRTGLMVGVFEMGVLNRLFARRSFGVKNVFKALVYLIVIITFLLAATAISNTQQGDTRIGNPALRNATWTFFSSFAFWSVALYIAVLMVIASFFYSDISDKLGQDVLYNYLTGTYHRPIPEERIIMFLDMGVRPIPFKRQKV